ncbi:MAG: AbrB/MazE/SpoVT family DNA-binding domain-containing protein [Rhodospirillales bacterium]|nr:AbrB/MazE/SpoVT family DNA-binding domain-containing protein [Rhodospirillales bacterium]
MDTTRLSSKGQVIIPKALRDALGWRAGMTFEVKTTVDGVLLRPARVFPVTSLDEVAGCLSWEGPPRTIRDMDEAVAREARRRARS